MNHLFLFTLTITLMGFSIFGCEFNSNSQSKKVNSKIEVNSIQPDKTTEVQKWKQDLLGKKLLGRPCDFTGMFTPEAEKWMKENPDQLDGLPSDDAEIASHLEDFNDDGQKDLLLYFTSQNCTGHNGGNPSFARIIYSDGQINDQLMDDIKTAILTDYKEKQQQNKSLKDVTGDYLNETTSISYDAKIRGECRLYTKNDAHCCASYYCTYIFDPVKKSIKLEVSPVKS